MTGRPEPWLFVALTPYHILVSLLISSTAPVGVRCDVVCPAPQRGFADLCRAVERRRRRSVAWSRVRVEPLPCPQGGRRARVTATSRVVRRFRAEAYTRVFVCHDTRPESLALADLARRRGVPVSYVEDGLGAYGRGAPAIGVASRAAVALAGGWVGRRFAHGERPQRMARCFAHVYCTAPELLPAGLGPTRQIPLEAPRVRSAAAVLVSSRQLDELPDRGSTGVVAAPLSDTPGAATCAELLRRLDDERDERSGPIAVKYHPREQAADPLGVADRPGFVLLDRSVPLEALLALRRTAFIVGSPSTALLFARRALPDLRVAGLDLSSEFGRVLHRAGVQPLTPTGPTGLTGLTGLSR